MAKKPQYSTADYRLFVRIMMLITIIKEEYEKTPQSNTFVYLFNELNVTLIPSASETQLERGIILDWFRGYILLSTQWGELNLFTVVRGHPPDDLLARVLSRFDTGPVIQQEDTHEHKAYVISGICGIRERFWLPKVREEPLEEAQLTDEWNKMAGRYLATSHIK